MFQSPVDAGWAGSLIWLAAVIVGSFAVSWLTTDKLTVRRAPYIGVLALVTAALTVGYGLWARTGSDFWTNAWGWGIVAALIAGGLLAFAVSRLPIAQAQPPSNSGWGVLWEAGVYGSTEGLLLSVLPTVITWQALAAIGWTAGMQGVAAGIAAVGASALVIITHHLGYRGYRGRRMIFPVIGCLVLTIAYLVTASPIAAMVGHIMLHAGLMRRGLEMPPHTSAWLKNPLDPFARTRPSRRGTIAPAH